jgi:hypothetical protein
VAVPPCGIVEGVTVLLIANKFAVLATVVTALELTPVGTWVLVSTTRLVTTAPNTALVCTSYSTQPPAPGGRLAMVWKLNVPPAAMAASAGVVGRILGPPAVTLLTGAAPVCAGRVSVRATLFMTALLALRYVTR